MKGVTWGMAALLIVGLVATVRAEEPADTYFSLAVTENSHNHYGENLLFLDFQSVSNPSVMDSRVVISPLVQDDSIQVDGDLKEWNSQYFTRIPGRVMNNYPLSEYYDARPGEILLASAYDSQYIYFAIDFEDANHDASNYRKQWIFSKGQWHIMAHRPLKPSRPAAVNATDELAGKESEDRVLFMFPIVDQQFNFRDGGLGCAAYCHPNLKEAGDPGSMLVGEKSAAMHTVLPEDIADVWHWTSTRSNPGRTLEDAHIQFAAGAEDGFKEDPGQSPDMENSEKSLKLSTETKPAYVNRDDFLAGRYNQEGFSSSSINMDTMLRITPEMTFVEGVTLPYSILRKATGSRSDVTSFGRFNPKTSRWTIEFKRKLDTMDPLDHAFVPGPHPPLPVIPPLKPGNPQVGQTLYKERACAHCHGDHGEGKFENGHWLFPRNQRTSGPVIAKTTSLQRPERLHAISFLDGNSQKSPQQIMPFVPLTPQEAEDIAAWLQTRFTPRGE